MGTRPSFAAIRFFRIPEGWVGNFTGDDIATRFEAFDQLVAA
jgi:1,2-dihydroxy-3-keto-5-methylthiopentene dioxygenase